LIFRQNTQKNFILYLIIPKIDFELIRKHFKEWEHHKVEDIMTYRNKSFSSPVTGSIGPVHHTPWETAMDDSLKTFLNK
jgi:trimethylamine monooxygenase